LHVTTRDAGARLRRLEELAGLLKSREFVTAAELAVELGVSLRTVSRDLALLREQGTPIEADRGRGGGMRLERNWALGRVHLSPEESIDLLLSLAIAERLNAALFQRLPAIRRKIVAAFAHGYQQRVRDLRRRILVGQPASHAVLATFTEPAPGSVSRIADAFFNMRVAALDYVDQHGKVSRREVEPQFLYLNAPVWYLLGWDRLRGAVRFFRVDRIRSIEVLPQAFRLGDPTPFLEAAENTAAHL
jgi:predicted DNA-binding transcriptional regulator YafY